MVAIDNQRVARPVVRVAHRASACSEYSAPSESTTPLPASNCTVYMPSSANSYRPSAPCGCRPRRTDWAASRSVLHNESRRAHQAVGVAIHINATPLILPSTPAEAAANAPLPITVKPSLFARRAGDCLPPLVCAHEQRARQSASARLSCFSRPPVLMSRNPSRRKALSAALRPSRRSDDAHRIDVVASARLTAVGP